MTQRKFKLIVDKLGIDVQDVVIHNPKAYAAADRIKDRIKRGTLVKVTVFQNPST